MKSKIGKPRRLVVLGFAGTILLGTVLLALPVSSAGGTGMPLIDSYFTATSAVCVTGLSCVDVGKELSVFGQIVLAALIQIGGLSITSIGVMAILGARGKLRMGKQLVFREALNLSSGKELANVIRTVFYMTVIIELAGAVLSYPVFVHEFGAEKAVGISVFHSIASFNNAGFDLMGNYKSLMDYRGNSWLYFVTEVLIILGGLGFFVIKELLSGKKSAALVFAYKSSSCDNCRTSGRRCCTFKAGRSSAAFVGGCFFSQRVSKDRRICRCGYRKSDHGR